MRYRAFSTALVWLAVAAGYAPATAQHPTPRWLFGGSAGYSHIFPEAFDGQRYEVDSNGNKMPSFCFGPPSDVAFSVYAGKPLGRLFHADAVLSAQLGDSGFNCVFVDEGPRPVTTRAYQGRSIGDVYAYNAARLVFEPGWQRQLVSPRISATAGWIWGKRTPVVAAAAGMSIGNAKLRFTLDVGEQLLWVPYQRVLQTTTYQQPGGAIVTDLTQTGTEHSHGAYFRFGFQRAVH